MIRARLWGVVALLAGLVHAADLPDVVLLKNGGMIRGAIVELVPGGHVLIRLPSGDERRFDMAEVEYAGLSEGLERASRNPSGEPEGHPAPDPARSDTDENASPPAQNVDSLDSGGSDAETIDRSSRGARAGVHLHDGLQVRLGLGPTFGIDHIYRTNADNSVDLVNPGVATEIAVGGTIGSIVLHAGIFNHVIPVNAGTLGYGAYTLAIDGGTTITTVYGIGLDWYPDPKKGFYAGAAPGVAVTVFGKNEERGAPENVLPRLAPGTSGVGVGLIAKVGYDWWVGEQWSLGVSGRLMLGDNPAYDPHTRHTFVLPSLLATVTYH